MLKNVMSVSASFNLFNWEKVLPSCYQFDRDCIIFYGLY
jgi:hypothetical protein